MLFRYSCVCAECKTGGYDNRVRENVVYHKELVRLAEDLGLKTATTTTIVSALNVPENVNILFLLSVPSTLKEMLLKTARLLIYTPSNEHFGLVPIEAMLAGLPVLAANTGGPLETVVDGKTGWLCDPEKVESWTAVMEKVLHQMSEKDLKDMGAAGVQRAKQEFSDTKMAETLESVIDQMASAKRKTSIGLSAVLATIVVIVLDATSWFASQSQSLNKRLDRVFLPPFTLTALSLVSWMAYIGLYMSRNR